MTTEEKINYALSLVEGATPGPWEFNFGWGLFTGNEIPVLERHPEDEYGWIEVGEPDKNLLLMAPLTPAALRLALAALETKGFLEAAYAREFDTRSAAEARPFALQADAMHNALAAFLALLPEPPKEG